MPLRIAAIADDYTGASDLANTWSKCGLKTVQTIGVPTHLDVSGTDALVVSFKIRSVPSSEAVTAALSAYQWLSEAGFTHVMYKICSTFDSTDQGNIGPVADALREKAKAAWSIVTPAFPETGRTIYQGNLFVGQTPLNESPLRHHPLNPMTDANLVRVLAKQSKEKVGLLNLASLRQDISLVEETLRQLVGGGVTLIIGDALEERDLELLGQLALLSPVSVGASGLGLGLARAVSSSQRSTRKADSTREKITGLAAILAGSCSAKTLEQIAEAEKSMPVLHLDVEQLVNSGSDISEALAWALERLTTGPVLIAASAGPEAVKQSQSTFGVETTSRTIEHAMGLLAAGLVANDVRKLVVAGGETSGAIVDHLKISGFEIGEEIAPGVPALRTLGRREGELAMALKSGNFGGTDFFIRALEKIG
jgi:3-dehydrotetronate 4-kinase